MALQDEGSLAARSDLNAQQSSPNVLKLPASAPSFHCLWCHLCQAEWLVCSPLGVRQDLSQSSELVGSVVPAIEEES